MQRLFVIRHILFAIIYYVTLSTAEDCVDGHESCPAWKPYCPENDWVRDHCGRSCGTCGGRLQIRGTPGVVVNNPNCVDNNENCRGWVNNDQSLCKGQPYINENCRKSCGVCGYIPPEFDINRLPAELKPISFLIGRWRSEGSGKARFPTIPVFTYGEQIEFTIAEASKTGPRALNYTSFAWTVNDQKELHSEYGFLAVSREKVALTTVMSNGFTTVEEGTINGQSVTLKLVDIGRISFSRDLPVHNMVREFVLIDGTTLEHRLRMETLTHPMQDHLYIRLTKIFP